MRNKGIKVEYDVCQLTITTIILGDDIGYIENDLTLKGNLITFLWCMHIFKVINKFLSLNPGSPLHLSSLILLLVVIVCNIPPLLILEEISS